MPGVLNRRCYTCGSAVSHTHGMHCVTEQGGYFFCRSKCRSSFERGCQRKRPRKQRPGAVAAALPPAAQPSATTVVPSSHSTNCPSKEAWGSLPGGAVLAQLVSWFERVVSKQAISRPATAPQPCKGAVLKGPELSWDALPGSFILDLLPLLELPDLLNMACVCRHWFDSVATAAKSIHSIDACDDESRWSRTIHLLPRVMPDIKSLSVTLHPLLTCRQIQVLSRYSQLEHLKLTVASDHQVNDNEAYWFPALARLTQLQSLEITVPGGKFEVEALSTLRQLTRLSITTGRSVSDNCGEFPAVDNVGEQVDALSSLPTLQDLTLHEELLPSTRLTQLATLTSLRILQLRPQPWHYADPEGNLDMEAYVSLLANGLGCLPCLDVLRLEFWEVPGWDLEEFRRVSDHEHDMRAMWLGLICQHLSTVPRLELRLSSTLRLVADTANFNRLASLTNLTALDLVFTDLEVPAVNISKLSTLTNLTSLRIATSNRVCLQLRDHIPYQHMHYLCSSLGQLTELKLKLRPDCFHSVFCLTSLNMLTSLKVLELGLPLDVDPKGWSEPAVHLPRSIRLDRLSAVVLEGYSASFVEAPFADPSATAAAAT